MLSIKLNVFYIHLPFCSGTFWLSFLHRCFHFCILASPKICWQNGHWIHYVKVAWLSKWLLLVFWSSDRPNANILPWVESNARHNHTHQLFFCFVYIYAVHHIQPDLEDHQWVKLVAHSSSHLQLSFSSVNEHFHNSLIHTQGFLSPPYCYSSNTHPAQETGLCPMSSFSNSQIQLCTHCIMTSPGEHTHIALLPSQEAQYVFRTPGEMQHLTDTQNNSIVMLTYDKYFRVNFFSKNNQQIKATSAEDQETKFALLKHKLDNANNNQVWKIKLETFIRLKVPAHWYWTKCHLFAGHT